MMQSYAIIGTGAVGGYYGGCLQKAGFPVHFLLRSDYDRVREKGLIIESVYGDFTLPKVNAYNNSKKMPQCDVIIVALKSTQNHLISQLLTPLVRKNSIIILLQNGLDFEREVAEIFPQAFVMGGLCFVCANKLDRGRIRHIDYQEISLAEYSPKLPTLCGYGTNESDRGRFHHGKYRNCPQRRFITKSLGKTGLEYSLQ
jgi:2-dehydropantoate 2-reductase